MINNKINVITIVFFVFTIQIFAEENSSYGNVQPREEANIKKEEEIEKDPVVVDYKVSNVTSVEKKRNNLAKEPQWSLERGAVHVISILHNPDVSWALEKSRVSAMCKPSDANDVLEKASELLADYYYLRDNSSIDLEAALHESGNEALQRTHAIVSGWRQPLKISMYALGNLKQIKQGVITNSRTKEYVDCGADILLPTISALAGAWLGEKHKK